MGSLYQITATQQWLNDAIEASEGVLTPELGEALSINEENLRQKAEDYSASILDAKARLKAIHDEKARLDKLQKSEQRKIDILSGRLSDALRLFGIDRLDAGKYRLSFRKSTQVVIEDEGSIPERFQTVTIGYDKQMLKTAITAGEEVPGAVLQETATFKYGNIMAKMKSRASSCTSGRQRSCRRVAEAMCSASGNFFWMLQPMTCTPESAVSMKTFLRWK